MNISTNHRAFSSGWFIKWVTFFLLLLQATVELFNELQLTVVSKTLELPLGKEDRRQGGTETCLKVKELKGSGSYPFMRNLGSREGGSISVSCLLRKVVPHRHCHELKMCSSAVKLAKRRQPCLSNTSTRVITFLLLQQKRIHIASTLGIPTMCLELNTWFSPGSFPSLTELSEEFLPQSSGVKSCFQRQSSRT